MANEIKKIKVTSKGQITIPREIRDKLEIKNGMYLRGYIKEGNIVLKPLPNNSNKAKLLSYAYQESKDNIGLARVREMTKGFNLNLQKQIRKLREEETGGKK